ncbi:dihydrodipicolinate synthase family protein [Psychromarinibacter halotolerans]|uniref:Dihydrodipicolinate synthase family protein n=1 Tax=Psychromarinibacter halotolerans TaxID=1775175 RepID=A0ABV7GV32_9RHOB|nr:dihydrodipicolinate synthase family protein [Psychromarinibacter halotolerans]MAQ84706.1 dihydrodipicolinate synthase family protein [Maritimibacter sp.]MDF0596257.1 dihydrodipicolinate synthase family protein [Psychromarinibacter halotolerans]
MPNEVALSVRNTLTGILPPLAMPFDDDSKLVADAIGPQIDMMVGAGVRGVVAGGSTGEGHTLSHSEFVTAMTEAHSATAGRVPFVAGLIVNSTRDAIERVEMLGDIKIDALQVTPVYYLFKTSLKATIKHFREIWEATQIPILIYNVIPWNYLSVDDMITIMDEVPGVVGMKQSSGDLKSVTDLLLRAKPENLVLSGIDALLYPAFSMGAHGAISALTCAVPGTTVTMFDAVQRGDDAVARDLHFKLNALWNAMPHDQLPACVKYVQSRQGLPLFHPRAPMEKVDADRQRLIDAALDPVLEATEAARAA